jgi:hypothetical protein
MNTNNGRLGLLLLAAFLVGVVSFVGDVDADPPVSEVYSTSVNCQPINLLSPDAGDYLTPVTCAAGFRAATLETESTTAAYICGRGATASNYTTVCRKRCVGCMNGSAIADDSNMIAGGAYNIRCVSGGVDAGVVFAVTCGK